MRDLKEVVADLTLENRILKKRVRGRAMVRHWSEDDGERGYRMRYPASEKLEIIEGLEGPRPARKAVEAVVATYQPLGPHTLTVDQGAEKRPHLRKTERKPNPQ
jgi:hypothetical protein